MSGNFTGMNVGEVRDLATVLNQKADEIDTLSGTVTSKLSGTNWVGTDRTNFENDWQSTGVQSLKTVAQMLRDAGQRATNNANEQEQASST